MRRSPIRFVLAALALAAAPALPAGTRCAADMLPGPEGSDSGTFNTTICSNNAAVTVER